MNLKRPVCRQAGLQKARDKVPSAFLRKQEEGKAHHYQSKASTITNGYVERLNKTLLDEFYSVAFRKKRYESMEALQIDLDNFMDYYNYRRTHQGYKLKKNGYRIPAEAHLQKDLTLQKEGSKIKIPESIRGRKEVVEKNLTVAVSNFKEVNLPAYCY